MNRPKISEAGIFQVSGSMDFFARAICDHPRLWQKLGNIETRVCGGSLNEVEIRNPVFITGLARSGSTILLEIMAGMDGVVTHRYKDFPPIYTPYAWNWLMNRAGPSKAAPAERAHRDGIMVTPDSPEAMEEVLWMSFFDQLHNPAGSNILDRNTSNPAFEKFYRDHIRKLLLSRDGDQYVAKANYHVTRLEYLLKIFPDARFVIPVRQPVAHIASLMKQHELFKQGQKANSRARQHLKRVGHFEFGLDRQPINAGSMEKTKEIHNAWRRGEEIRGWAMYWSSIYGYIADLLENNQAVRDASFLVRFEDLCDEPKANIRTMFGHCGFSTKDHTVNAAAGQIRKPSYYSQNFADEEIAQINFETYETASRLCY